MAESFDAVLADIRQAAIGWWAIPALSNTMAKLANRLQSAHEAEVAERDARIADLQAALYRWVPHADYGQQAADDAMLLMGMTECSANEPGESVRQRADRAVGLLRECEDAVFGKELWERIRAFLSEQAGERENGDG